MDFDATAQGGESASELAPPRFKVLIAYDVPANARRGLRLAESLAGQFGKEFEIQRDLWRFDIITLLGRDENAGRGVVNPDLLIVAANGDGELPAPVRIWLDAWGAQCLPGSAALVALLETRPPEAGRSSPARDFLQALAAHAGLEFFAHEFSVPAEGPAAPFLSLQQRAEQSSSGLRGILGRAPAPLPRKPQRSTTRPRIGLI